MVLSRNYLNLEREDLRKRKKLEEDIEKFAHELIKIQAQRQSQMDLCTKKTLFGKKNLKQLSHLRKQKTRKSN